LSARDAYNRHSLVSILLAAHDSNSRYRHVQTGGQQTPKSIIRAIFYGRRHEANFEGTLVLASDGVAARSRCDADRKSN
jgi:hypothetical protein